MKFISKTLREMQIKSVTSYAEVTLFLYQFEKKVLFMQVRGI